MLVLVLVPRDGDGRGLLKMLADDLARHGRLLSGLVEIADDRLGLRRSLLVQTEEPRLEQTVEVVRHRHHLPAVVLGHAHRRALSPLFCRRRHQDRAGAATANGRHAEGSQDCERVLGRPLACIPGMRLDTNDLDVALYHDGCVAVLVQQNRELQAQLLCSGADWLIVQFH